MKWRLSTMFVLTSLVAIILGFYRQLGVGKTIVALCLSWMGLIGVICIYLGVTDRSHGYELSIGIGIVFIAMSFFSLTWLLTVPGY